jgi:hypothetical protein
MLHSITLHFRAITLLTGLLAASWPSQANIVGYVNADLTNGYNFVSNPLRASTNDCLTNIVQFAPTGSRAYVWDVTNQVFLPHATRLSSAWNKNYDLPVGRGFVLFAPVRWTNTFVGNVLSGMQTNVIVGSNQYTLLGNKLPEGGPISDLILGSFPKVDGASAHFFRSVSQSFSGYTSFTNYGWFDPTGVEGTNGPTYSVAEGFFVQNPGPETLWTNIFVGARPAPGAPTAVEVTRLIVEGGMATLEWADPGGGLCDVQFSTDGRLWTTIAARQSGNTWTGSLPALDYGRFQVVTSNIERSLK